MATIFSPYVHQSRQWLVMITGYATLFYLLVAFVDRWERVRTVTMIIVLMGLAEAAWTIVQGVVWNVVRPSGTFFNPNFLAGYLTVSWAIVLSIAVYGYRKCEIVLWPPPSPALWRLGMTSALCALLVAIVLTQSRGGMVAWLAATVCILTARYGVPLSTEIKNGDVIEVLTGDKPNPNPAWLSFVRTGRARSKIRHFLKSMAHDESLALGEKMLIQALRLEGIADMPSGDAAAHGLWEKLLRFTGNRNVDELLADIGMGKRIASMVAKKACRAAV